MSLTTDDNVRYGLVYVEDIYQVLESHGRFELKESDRCRKAVCKRIPEETLYYRDLFIRRGGRKLTDAGIDAGKLFDILAEAFRHSHNRSHAVANLFAAARKDDIPVHPLEVMTKIVNNIV
jgi:DNA polymerase III alpha subunit